MRAVVGLILGSIALFVSGCQKTHDAQTALTEHVERGVQTIDKAETVADTSNSQTKEMEERVRNADAP